MSKKLLKCKCGGTYMEGSDRHFKTNKHIEYLNELEKYKDIYCEAMGLLMTEKFGGDNRFQKSKTYLEKRLDGAPDKNKRIRDIRDEFRKRLYMSIQD